MEKQEFLDNLRKKLSGNLSSYDVEDNIRYYDDYISGVVQQGKTEEQVIEEIGSPLLVAKTIIDTYGVSGGRSSKQNENPAYKNEYSGEEEAGPQGFQANYDEKGWDIRYGKMKVNTWYWKLLAIVVVVVVLVIILSIIGSIVSFILPVVLPVIIILIVISIFSRGRRR